MTLDRVSWSPALDGKPIQRIDAIAKVTGAKVFARDVRAKDMPGWPDNQSFALILRIARTDCVYQGLDLSSLPPEARPDRVVTANEDGPGNGQWNFDRYRLPRAQDVSVWKQSIEILAPLSDSDPPKGFSEAAVIPVAPAIGNAIAHACGKRLYDFPMTASKIKEQLL